MQTGKIFVRSLCVGVSFSTSRRMSRLPLASFTSEGKYLSNRFACWKSSRVNGSTKKYIFMCTKLGLELN